MSEKSRGVALFVCNGASGHALEEREPNDYYATSSEAAEWLLKIEPQLNNILEPAVGEGHLAKVFNKAKKLGGVMDLIDRGYYPDNVPYKYGEDFLKLNKKWKGDVVTNPPYANGADWAQKQLDIIEEGRYSVLFMKITFLEGKGRKDFFKENPPIRVWVSSSRIPCAKNGEFEKPKKDKDGNILYNEEGEPIMIRESSAACYAWYVWKKGYKGPTELKWFN